MLKDLMFRKRDALFWGKKKNMKLMLLNFRTDQTPKLTNPYSPPVYHATNPSSKPMGVSTYLVILPVLSLNKNLKNQRVDFYS